MTSFLPKISPHHQNFKPPDPDHCGAHVNRDLYLYNNFYIRSFHKPSIYTTDMFPLLYQLYQIKFLRPIECYNIYYFILDSSLNVKRTGGVAGTPPIVLEVSQTKRFYVYSHRTRTFRLPNYKRVVRSLWHTDRCLF